ncbi:ATP-binding cassette, subfamily C, CydD [Ectothiorhodosinus mongolicus]|uniref:ATP-binding cassette, subfamily C, CydD n=1 Tax=Ectothiorhodosinus mongolicus TaxID=233100 RepID=A0A1R3VMM7_9GAMM|nr:thiol reductant ABC exporter subunit CydD [Ectothiorhodosinus mongolicus]SIT65797.1 ATP-binding cassette, subfamily C, CydD [Ectothiorhodosinus mongolicus]
MTLTQQSTEKSHQITPGDAQRWLAAQTGAESRLLQSAVFAGAVGGWLVIAQAGLIAWILTQILLHSAPASALLGAFVSLAAVMLLRVTLGWVREVLGQRAALGIQGRLRQELFAHLGALGPVRLADYHSGSLSAALVEQIEALGGYYQRYLPQVKLALLIPVGILLAAAWLHWLSALILLLIAPLIPLALALFGMGAARISRRQQATVARLGGHFLDRLQGLVTLRLLNAQGAAARAVYAAADGYRQSSMKVLRVAFLSSAALELVSAAGIALVAILIGFTLMGWIDWAWAPEISLFAGLFVLLMTPEFFAPLRQWAQSYHDRANAIGAAQNLIPLLHREAPKAAPVHTRNFSAAKRESQTGAEVQLDDVSVHYGRGQPALHEVSLSIKPGEKIALVGPSGSGKSTLLHVLAGFIQADSGSVHINGADPDPINQIAWVGQRPHAFSGTLADNIRLGNPDADTGSLEHAATQAGVMKFARALPAGLDTPLGERGHGLSGGQAQRLALARAVLKKAPLWLLDEPTAGLDPDTEAQVLDALEQSVRAGATVLIASHHPRVMAFADRVIHLSDGRVSAPEAALP